MELPHEWFLDIRFGTVGYVMLTRFNKPETVSATAILP